MGTNVTITWLREAAAREAEIKEHFRSWKETKGEDYQAGWEDACRAIAAAIRRLPLTLESIPVSPDQGAAK